MFVAVWKYEVKEESIEKFEDLYGQEGKWVKLFKENAGYLITEFIKNMYEFVIPFLVLIIVDFHYPVLHRYHVVVVFVQWVSRNLDVPAIHIISIEY